MFFCFREQGEVWSFSFRKVRQEQGKFFEVERREMREGCTGVRWEFSPIKYVMGHTGSFNAFACC